MHTSDHITYTIYGIPWVDGGGWNQLNCKEASFPCDLSILRTALLWATDGYICAHAYTVLLLIKETTANNNPVQPT